MPFNAPNLLTLLRIVLIPLFVALFYLPAGWLTHHEVNLLATAVFGLAALTDWFDGWLARTLNQTSAFGAFLDPVADKLMVATALVVLVAIGRVHPIIAVIIIGREITISALREWMAKTGDHKSVAVSFLGKIKTIAQMVAIVLLLYQDPIPPGINAFVVGTWLIYLAAVLTLWSMFYYLRIALPKVWGR
ncbi:MAG TPA: CDP-diacylglycerol--glycerol-3-phosphate 3-phosphatidyltransferase [Burkholderiales bacterium]|nr:CDP-diacylglycerol--glycerol-3-phosphate 3-phosphatidyltransferase [Burkholderiales bacterium]